MAVYDLGSVDQFDPNQLPRMNRAGHRRLSAKVRAAQRATGAPRAAERLCRVKACGCASCGTLDRAHGPAGMDRGNTLVAAVGQVMGIPALGAVSQSDGMSDEMLRASNLAAVTVYGLRLMPEAERAGVLAESTSPEFARSVLAFARKVPGLGLDDRTRFALAMHYLSGIIDARSGRDTELARVYTRAVAAFREGQSEGQQGLGGLGAVECSEGVNRDAGWIKEPCAWRNTQGNRDAKIKLVRDAYQAAMGKAADPCAVNYYTQMRWCSKATLIGVIKGAEPGRIAGRAPNPNDTRDRNLFTNAGDSIAKGAKAAGDALDSAFSWGTDILCRGLKAVLGDTVGGFLCSILSKGLELVKNMIEASIEIIRQVATGIVEFVRAIIAGDVMGAVKALVVRVTSVIFVIPPIGPFFASFLGVPLNDRQKAKAGPNAPMSLVELGERVAKRSPFFILSLALAIVGVLVPTPVSVGALIIALAPAIGVLLASQLKRLDALKGIALEALESGIERFIRIVTTVVMGVMKLTEMFKKLWGNVRAYLAKKAPTAVATAGAAAGTVMQRFQDKWGVFWQRLTDPFTKGSVQNFNLSAVATAASALLSFAPDIVAALGLDDADTRAIVSEAEGAYNAGKKLWQDTEAAGTATTSLPAASAPQASPATPQRTAVTVAAPVPGASRPQPVDVNKLSDSEQVDAAVAILAKRALDPSMTPAQRARFFDQLDAGLAARRSAAVQGLSW